ncbi:MAG: sigma-70 family RNA polymerase sigma factor [Lachnospiraceae bacterium]|nr:sigma-70 family RNA polymerase sigma factor [Lachnospiraceae bacterium]MDE6981644.1 sigma-70 family RNA polymerase sigma factor [Lachnospiraceae bacterium]
MDYEEQYDRIYRYCYYKLKQKEMAEDITQETFLRFFGKEKYREGEHPMKVMYTIAKNLCTDEFRKKNCMFLEDVKGEVLQNKGPEDDIVNAGALSLAMEKLDNISREILFFRFVNQESFAVIGGMYHLSRYAVYRKYQKALKILRKELEK